MNEKRVTSIISGAILAIVIGGAAVTFGPLLTAQPVTSTPAPIVRLVGDAPTPAPAPTVQPTPEPVAVVEPEPEPAPAPEPEPPAGLPSGSPVPFVPSSDPNNAAGGDYDVSQCASGTASTVGGVPVCD